MPQFDIQPYRTEPSQPLTVRLFRYLDQVYKAIRAIDGTLGPLDQMLSGSAVLDFPNIPANSEAELTITVTGAAADDAVAISVPAAAPTGLEYFGRVTAADTVTIRAFNVTAGAINPPAATFRAVVIKY